MPSGRRQPATSARATRATDEPPPPQRLVSVSGRREIRVKRRWVKGATCIFLLPVVWVMGRTFFDAFRLTASNPDFVQSAAVWSFAGGALVWLALFFGIPWKDGAPRLMRAYVFGHEYTHALWVWVFAGRVYDVKYEREGGYVVASKTNTWIALAPYFFPLYALWAMVFYGILGFFFDMEGTQWALYAVVGFFWAFHFSFTCWMIPRGQTDLTYGGTIFSLLVIVIGNLALLSALLIVASPDVTVRGFLRALLGHTIDAAVFAETTAVWLGRQTMRLLRWVWAAVG